MPNSLTSLPVPNAQISVRSQRVGNEASRRDRNRLIGFVLFLIASQVALVFLDRLALVIGGTGPVRIAIRIGTFAASLYMLLNTSRRGQAHPSSRPAVWVLAIVAISIFHPTTNSLTSGTAQAVLYFAILAPVFWASRLTIDGAAFRNLVTVLWGFHAVSAALGVAQVYYPGIFQPSLSPVIAAQGEEYLASLRITTARGASVYRPMGLTDMPGGAATSGFFSVLFGIGLFLTDRRAWLRVACLVSMVLGMGTIYLSQVRSILLMAIISVIAFAAVLASRGHVARLGLLATVTAGVIVGSFALAVAVGGESVTSRLATLVAENPTQVYHSNRGRFLEETVDELLPRYPIGAGMGRWGMMNSYFGDNSDPDRQSIWVEIQWTGWLLDGGVPLILAYVAALLLALLTAWRISGRTTAGGSDLYLWAALIVGYNVGAIAITFNYPLFIGQGGLEFWLLNGALFAAAASSQVRHRPMRMSHG